MTLPRPRGRQSDVIFLPGSGHQVVLGTAGTGKTTMAMLRAIHLAAPATQNSGPVLAVTYNNTLVTYLRHLRDPSAGNITIETYGRFARGYLNSIGLMPSWGGIASPGQRHAYVEQAVRNTAATYQPSRFFHRDTGFFRDELEWISGMEIQTLDDYKAASRVGRKTGLADSWREVMWKILIEYRRIRHEAGPKYDWYDLATAVRAALAHDNRRRLYKHVVIDEGQDLSPEAVRSLVEACDPAGSVTFFGDYHQMIYGQGVSWQSCGLDIQKVERFADNYRNTTEVARLAIAMSKTPPMAGDPKDLVVPNEPPAAGSLPTLARCADEEEEIRVVQAQAKDYAQDGTVAVLARTWADARRVCRGLDVRKLHHDLTNWDTTPGIYCGAYHSAKGLEFDAVIMPFCGATHMPHPDVTAAFGYEGAAAREARLMYVGITRARTDLLLTYSGEITPLLPSETGLYAKVAP
jgi:superfamily I DNA/RNA helicase